MALLTLKDVFDDDKDYSIPARVNFIENTTGYLVFIKPFATSHESIKTKIRQGFLLKGCKKIYKVEVDSYLVVSCKGSVLNNFILSEQSPKSFDCIFEKIIDKKYYKNLIEKLNPEKFLNTIDTLNKIENDALNELEKKESDKIKLDAEIAQKITELGFANNYVGFKEELTTIRQENQQLKSQTQQLKKQAKEYKWAETIKHHFQDHIASAQTVAHHKQPNLSARYQKILPQLTNTGLNADFAHTYLLSLFTSLLNGRFLLLTGNVGTGKSHLIKQSGQLLGGQTNMVAVRPAWLDSSDLLGYFDPLNNKFHATDFTQYLAQPNDGCINMILLDEMNIARIENYGADILASLSPVLNNQRQSDANKITLYTNDVQEMLLLTKLYAQVKDIVSVEQQAELSPLLKRYQAKIPSSISIADNVLICGTLNIDGSTENLSPKMIDRSLILKFPDFDGQLTTTKMLAKIDNVGLPISALVSHIDTIKDEKYYKKWNDFYNSLGDIKDCFVPLSRRVAEDYVLFHKLNDCFKITSDMDVIDSYFIYSRLLPRLKIERMDRETRDALQAKLQHNLFGVFVTAIKQAVDGEYIDYQHICG